MRDLYDSFSELRKHHVEGVDFDRLMVSRPQSKVLVMAPHGGRLENHTDTIAQAIAGADFSLYCFRSRLGRNTPNLHITSHRFDDPDCVSMVSEHPCAVAIHGCSVAGERAFLGGRDSQLIEDLARALSAASIRVDTRDHPYPGTHPRNIVNRTSTGMGAQLELSIPLRRSSAVNALVIAVRGALLARQGKA